MSERRVGFCVIYRWRLVPGTEKQFQQAWEQLTHEIRTHAGGLGSRLHQADDGTWIAYAQWPSREAWVGAKVETAEARAAMRVYGQTVEHRFEPILLDPVIDHLQIVAGAAGGANDESDGA